jgi:hypothetical protein
MQLKRKYFSITDTQMCSMFSIATTTTITTTR